MGKLTAGAAAVDITPTGPTFLFGYPHVERASTGVHDPLLASALFISDGPTAVVLIECDVIFTPKDLVARARARLADQVRTLCGDATPAEIRSAGGAARSALWRQIKSRAVGCPVVATTCDGPTSLGAAILAAAALGWGHVTDLVEAWVRVAEAGPEGPAQGPD